MITQRNYEPKRKHNFVVEFNGINIEPFVVQYITLPKLINNKWDDITISCIDLVPISTAKILYQFYKENKKKWFSQKPIFDITVSMLDPTSVEIEKWYISVKKIKEIDFGYCSYNVDNANEIIIIIEPLNCKLI
jgi:hypothetical protein